MAKKHNCDRALFRLFRIALGHKIDLWNSLREIETMIGLDIDGMENDIDDFAAGCSLDDRDVTDEHIANIIGEWEKRGCK